jgi:hypothetical protein
VGKRRIHAVADRISPGSPFIPRLGVWSDDQNCRAPADGVAYPDEAWRGCRTPRRIEAASELMASRRARNEEISLVDCLEFCDKREIAASLDLVEMALDSAPKSSSS